MEKSSMERRILQSTHAGVKTLRAASAEVSLLVRRGMTGAGLLANSMARGDTELGETRYNLGFYRTG